MSDPMTSSSRDPEGTAEKPTSSEEDTFLFMGTRIPLAGQAAKKAKPREKQELSPTGQPTPQSDAAIAGLDQETHSSKLSFNLEPLAGVSKASSSGRIFVLGGGLLLVVVAALLVWHRLGSNEARMFRAAAAGQLFVPRGLSAFDHYQTLKAGGVSPVTKDRLKSEVLPQLSEAGNELLNKVREGADLTEAEVERLAATYEWATEIDPQDNGLQARRAYAAACRASFKKADSEVLAALREAFQTDSQWALPFRDLARLYGRAGNYANAEYFYQQAVLLDPKWILPGLELGKLALDRGRLAEAELAFRRSIEADRASPLPWVELGTLYEFQKRKVEAVAAYERSLQLAQQRQSPDFDSGQVEARLKKLR
ncbi:MAG: hypothetical protein FJW26_02710 [Acidimicrobiia bacterium]|nr:hypothetical protein [Acidimicrobiia bacterium]